MKKYGKRVAATGMVAVMTATLSSGCGTKATPENLFKDMSENMKDIKIRTLQYECGSILNRRNRYYGNRYGTGCRGYEETGSGTY